MMVREGGSPATRRLLEPRRVFRAAALAVLGAAASGWGVAAPGVAPAAAAPASAAPASAASALAPPGPQWEAIGSYGGPVRALAMREGLALVGMGRQVLALDIGDPRSPRRLGASGSLPGLVQAILLNGREAWVVAGGTWLVGLDMGDPARPVQRSALDLAAFGGFAGGIARNGPFIYLSQASTIAVIDVSDPVAPALAGNLPFGFTSVLRMGDGFLVAVSEGQQLLFLSTADPRTPVPVQGWSFHGRLQDLAVAGRYVYAAGSEIEQGRVTVAILELGSLDRPPRLVATLPVEGAAWSETRLELAPGRLRVSAASSTHSEHSLVTELDIGDPEAPRRRGRLLLPGAVASMDSTGDTLGLALDHDGLALADLAGGSPTAWPALPLPRPLYDGLTLGHFAAGNRVYALGRAGLLSLDARDPTRPWPVALYRVPVDHWVSAMAQEGDRAYLTLVPRFGPGQQGLLVLGLSDAEAPRPLGFFETPDAPRAVVAAGGLVYLANGQGLRVIDPVDPARPREIGAYRALGPLRHLALGDGMAYIVSTGGRGDHLELLDLGDPSAPARRAQRRMGTVSALAVAGRTLILVEDGHLVLLDASDPAQPVERARSALPVADLARLTVLGERVYVTLYSFGFDPMLASLAPRLQVFEIAGEGLREVWRSNAFGSPTPAGAWALADGPSGELVILRHRDPPRLYLPLARQSVGG